MKVMNVIIIGDIVQYIRDIIEININVKDWIRDENGLKYIIIQVIMGYHNMK